MKPATRRAVTSGVLVAEGLLLGLSGIGVGHADDAPGAGLIGLVLFLAFSFAAYRAARPPWRVMYGEDSTA